MLKSLLVALGALSSVQAAIDTSLRIGSGGRTIHDFLKEIDADPDVIARRDLEARAAPNPEKLYPKRYFDMPVDHFPDDPKYAPHTDRTYKNRYWFDDSHYKPGGPVIILQSGETNGLSRLPYMQDGILAMLAEATNGMAVVFEHRYYGYSFPTRYLTTEDLRFLTTEQALADEQYFAENIVFPGHEDKNLTASATPWISYGGSYSGAFSAFLRVKYPHTFWGSISSSGVTKAIYDYWEYYAPVAQYGPQEAMLAQKLFTDMVDKILIDKASNKTLTQELKAAFGMPNVTHAADFANQLAGGVGLWQSLNWDPLVSYDGFYWFAGNISSTKVLWPKTESKRSTAEMLLQEGGYAPNKTITNQLLNYIGWIYENTVQYCTDVNQDSCFSNLNKTFYEQTGQDQAVWRSWSYQYCTEWGYLQTGSGVPKDQMPLISRTIDIEYTSAVCRFAFDIHHKANVTEANQYGGYDIRSNRLAIIDGQWDPWRPATPHAFQYGAPHRTSTTQEPFILISKALHHYDENGRFPNETTPSLPPKPVAQTQHDEETFVKAWVGEWHASKKAKL